MTQPDAPSRSRTQPSVLALGFAAFLALVMLVPLGRIAERGTITPVTDANDFRAFYCASRTLLARQDPYRIEPLGSCERAAAQTFGLAMRAPITPAPLPGFALAALAPLARLPYDAASSLWFRLSIVLLLAGIVATARVANVRLALVAAAFMIPVAYVSISVGQVGPLLVATIAGIALAVRARRMDIAALLCAPLCVEPHLALPVFASLFAFVPAMRAYLIAVTALLGVAQLAAVGPAITREYATVVVPMHAITEIAWREQFSLTSLLWRLGTDPLAASRIGDVWYAGACCVGVALGRSLWRHFNDAAFLVVVPVAVAVIGGAYIHLFQIAVALPFAFLAFARFERARWATVTAMILLAIPLHSVLEWTSYEPRFQSQLRTARQPVSAPIIIGRNDRNPIVEQQQLRVGYAGLFEQPKLSENVTLVTKIPTWLGLLALVGSAFANVRTFDRSRRPVGGTHRYA